MGVPLLGTAAQATFLIPAPFDPFVHCPGQRLETQEEVEAPCQTAIEGHGHHNERRHDDKAEDDEGRRAVVIQDGLAVIGGRVEHLQQTDR